MPKIPEELTGIILNLLRYSLTEVPTWKHLTLNEKKILGDEATFRRVRELALSTETDGPLF